MENPEPNNETKKYIFMSYSPTDRKHAKEFINELQKENYRVWLDEEVIIGEAYNTQVVRAIQNSTVFLCLLSENYNLSRYCQREIEYAIEKYNKPIIPVFLGDYKRIRESMSYFMRVSLLGVKSIILDHNDDIPTFMTKIKNFQILNECIEEKTESESTNEVYLTVPNPSYKVMNSPCYQEAKCEDIVTFGRYFQDKDGREKKPLEWIVLEKYEDRVLLISKYAVDCKAYHEIFAKETWETCSLRKWLNTEFYNQAFNHEEKSIVCISHVNAEKNPEYDTDPGLDTSDKLFLLSISEAKRYFSKDEKRECLPTEYAIAKGLALADDGSKRCMWWLRNNGGSPDMASFVSLDGSTNATGLFCAASFVSVRPAMWVMNTYD